MPWFDALEIEFIPHEAVSREFHGTLKKPSEPPSNSTIITDIEPQGANKEIERKWKKKVRKRYKGMWWVVVEWYVNYGPISELFVVYSVASLHEWIYRLDKCTRGKKSKCECWNANGNWNWLLIIRKTIKYLLTIFHGQWIVKISNQQCFHRWLFLWLLIWLTCSNLEQGSKLKIDVETGDFIAYNHEIE